MRRTAIAIVCLTLLLAAPVALAQTEGEVPDRLELSTPYPAVAVEPGDQVTFRLTVASPVRQEVDLEVAGLPAGWTGVIRGGGFELDSVMAGPGASAEVDLNISIPAGAPEETVPITVTATAGGQSSELTLRLRVSAVAGGDVTLEPDFPALRAASGETVTFNVTVRNDTPADLQFELDASGPAGWVVRAQPAGQAQAATLAVDAGSSGTIRVEATSPPRVEAGEYPIAVKARAGTTEVSTELIVAVVGTYSMDLTTSDQRLNAEVTVGSSSELNLVVVNTGTAPLTGVTLSATAPREWEVTFDRDALEPIPPGEAATVVATITPSRQAIAGDYVITFSASGDDARDTIEVRTTVSPSPLWGFLGIGLIALTLAGLAWVFRRFGRR